MIKDIYIPDSVTSIGYYALGYYASDDGEYYVGNDNMKLIPGFKLKCHAGSAAEQYAKDNGINYELI